MYEKIKDNSKCSICNSINFYEIVYRNEKTFKRCRKCGHEKIISPPEIINNFDDYTNIDIIDIF